MSKKEIEYVEITLKLPKGIVDFLKDMGEDVEEYLVRAIVCDIAAGLEADAFWDPKYLVKKHNLMPAFKKYEAGPSSYINPEVPLGTDC